MLEWWRGDRITKRPNQNIYVSGRCSPVFERRCKQPIGMGASLVLIYRDPRLPYNGIVIYDGGYTMNNATDSMTQTIKGFYQAAGPTEKITHIVGGGQANKTENLRRPGTATQTGSSTVVNPFASTLGANWDNPTY